MVLRIPGLPLSVLSGTGQCSCGRWGTPYSAAPVLTRLGTVRPSSLEKLVNRAAVAWSSAAQERRVLACQFTRPDGWVRKMMSSPGLSAADERPGWGYSSYRPEVEAAEAL